MATTFLEPGGDATFALGRTNGLWTTNVSGSIAVATDFVHGNHTRSIKPPTTAATGYVASPDGVVRDAGTRISIYIYLNALPTVSSQHIFGIENAGDGSVIGGVYISTGGVLQIWNSAPSQIGTNGSTLSTGIWYRISLAYTISSTTVNRFELFKDGISDISITNATLTNTISSDLVVGKIISTGTIDIRFSDIYVDNSSALTDPGNIWVTAKRPNANGTANQFTTQIGAGGSGYGTGHSPQVNERILSTTNGWSLSNTTVQTEEYSIEGKSVGDIDISTATIIDFMGWISAKVDSTLNSPVHHIIVGGTSTVKTLTTAANVYMQIKGSSTYPIGGTDIGIDAAFTTTPHTTSLFECGIVVAFIPGGTPVTPIYITYRPPWRS